MIETVRLLQLGYGRHEVRPCEKAIVDNRLGIFLVAGWGYGGAKKFGCTAHRAMELPIFVRVGSAHTASVERRSPNQLPNV